MALYYLPLLIRSDRYFVAKLDSDAEPNCREETDYNFVVHADHRVLTPLITIEDPSRVLLNQMAPSDRQDILLRECQVSLRRRGNDAELLITKSDSFAVIHSHDEETGLRLDYSAHQKRIHQSEKY